MIKTIVFDADGVLVNGDKFSDALVREHKIDDEKVREFFKGPFQRCLVGEADLKEELTPYLDAFDWQGTPEELLDFWFKSEHKLDEDIMNYAAKLRASGIKLVLATNQEKYRTEYMLEHMGFKDCFDHIYSSAQVGLKKPSQEFYAKIVDDLGLDKSEVLFWDDDPPNIEGAKAYGINAELYAGFENFLTTAKAYGL